MKIEKKKILNAVIKLREVFRSLPQRNMKIAITFVGKRYKAHANKLWESKSSTGTL